MGEGWFSIATSVKSVRWEEYGCLKQSVVGIIHFMATSHPTKYFTYYFPSSFVRGEKRKERNLEARI